MMFAPRYTVWHCGTLKKGRREMSNTPKTDKLFFPFGRDHTAAASPSFLTCMTEYELLEMENAALREQIKWVLHELKTAANRLTDCQQTTISARDCIGRVEAAMKEEGK